MPLPPVVIELSPRDVASEHASALVEACGEAVRDGSCEVVGREPRADARAVAIVSSNDEYTKIRIELGTRRAGETRWAIRVLDFGSADPELERAKTVGFVIGSLVGEAERAAQQAAAPRAPTDPKASTTPGAPQPKAKPNAALTPFVELGPKLDSALDRGAPRFGAALRVGAVVRPPWEAYVGGAYSVRPRDARVQLRWLSVELGAGVTHPLTSALALHASAAPFAERLDADADGPRPHQDGRWVFGVAARSALHFQVVPRISLFVGTEFAVRESGTAVSLEGEDLGRQPAFSFGASAGARIGIF